MSRLAVFCIIGARKGSKRLPNKNKLILNEKPLYVYTVEAAINSGVFSKIIFTTDDDEIIKDLKTYSDVLIDRRPHELSMDNVVMWDVGVYILNKYLDILSETKDICFLTPCHPFRTEEHIRKAYQLFRKSNATSIVSITQYPFPTELSLDLIDNRVARKWSGPIRRDEHRKKYYPNGAVIIVDRAYFFKHKDVYSSNTIGYEMEWPYCLDIDYEEDFLMALKIAKLIV